MITVSYNLVEIFNKTFYMSYKGHHKPTAVIVNSYDVLFKHTYLFL